MNDLATTTTTTTAGQLLAGTPDPALEALETFLRLHDREIETGGDASTALALPPAVREAALAELAKAEALWRPADPKVALKWLAALARGFPNPPQGRALATLCRTLWEDCRSFPHGVWTETTVSEARCLFETWPSSAQLHRFMVRHTQPLWARRATLEAVLARAGQSPPAEPRKPPTDAEKAAVRVVVESLSPPAAPVGAATKRVGPVSAGSLMVLYAHLAEHADLPSERAAAAARLATLQARAP